MSENYPMREPAFEKHFYASPSGLRPAEMYSIDNHSLIARTVSENERALDDIEEEISGR